MYGFFVTVKAKSTHGYQYMQLFVSVKDFVYVAPMKSKSAIPQALKEFATKLVYLPNWYLTPEGSRGPTS